MKKKALTLLFMAVLASCSKKESPYMTPEAIAAVDRFCGEYKIAGMELTDGSIDLDGDGISSIYLMEEMKKTGWLGASSPFDELLSRVPPKTRKDQQPQILLYFPTGEGEVNPWILQTVRMENLQFRYDVDDHGVITAPVNSVYSLSSIENFKLNIIDDWNIEAYGTIDLYDRSLEAHVKRTVHVIYHCVSTKEKPKN